MPTGYGGFSCSHCQEHGTVRTKTVERKERISGAKATSAVLTGGLLVLANGLSRKEGKTQTHCDNSDCKWCFEPIFAIENDL